MGILLEAGADPKRVIVGHLDRTIFDKKLLKNLAETGCFLEYDVFGQETSLYPAAPHIDMPNDAQRLNMLAWLISEGHGGQLLVSHDIARRTGWCSTVGTGTAISWSTWCRGCGSRASRRRTFGGYWSTIPSGHLLS